MTLDMHPERWRRMARLFLLWLDLPEKEAERLLDALPQSEQDLFDTFLDLKVGKTPQKVLKKWETLAKRGELDAIDTRISKLPRIELEKLAKAGLKRGKLIDNLSKMGIEELRQVVLFCSFPKELLVYLLFIEGLDTERKEFLLWG